MSLWSGEYIRSRLEMRRRKKKKKILMINECDDFEMNVMISK